MKGERDAFVAALAELGGLTHQKAVMVRPVHRVAVQAVRLNRRVFEAEGTALFRMAHVAQLVDRISPEHLGTEGPMGVMAVRAFDLAFPDRMMGLLVRLHADVLVTVEAEVRLAKLQAFADAGMQRVAVRAGNAV